MNYILGIIGGKKAGKKTLADYIVKNFEAKSRTSLLNFEMAMISNIFNFKDIGNNPNYPSRDQKFDPPILIGKVEIKEILREMGKTLYHESDFTPAMIPYGRYEMGASSIFNLVENVEFKIIRDAYKLFFAESYATLYSEKLSKISGTHIIWDITYNYENEYLKNYFGKYYRTIKIKGGESYDGLRGLSDYDFIKTDFEIQKEGKTEVFYEKFEKIFKLIKKSFLKENIPTMSFLKRKTKGE